MIKKPRLIILSDIWGNSNPEWAQNLTAYFQVRHYDCRSLAELPDSLTTENEIHQYFVHKGIQKAVAKICLLETMPIHIIGFSLGGVIAWKASLGDLKAKHLFCVSSTRLRLETQKPDASISLFFGEHDIYAPNKEWYAHHQIIPNIIPNQDHKVYENECFLKLLLKEVSKT
ncbi:hypothetical protein KFE94_09375 [bacterium SCSIO 12643]|nr:hypothetical protein KFE94_09375 [bacterium SCSIO 12643]